MPRDRPCPYCPDITRNGHLQRHINRHHPETIVSRSSSLPTTGASTVAADAQSTVSDADAKPAIQELAKVSDVLTHCGIDPQQLPWPPKLLDKLPNLRLGYRSPLRAHTPWTILPPTELDPTFTMQSIILGLNTRLAQKKPIPNAEAWVENSSIPMRQPNWLQWHNDILCGRTQRLRLLNVPLGELRIPSVNKGAIMSRARESINTVYPQEAIAGFNMLETTFNLNPKGTWTDVHHDSLPHVSRGIGMTERQNEPLKLWLIWPSTETTTLSRFYSDTTAALNNLNHGSFFVQMPGETLVVPPNSAHAVYSLNSCVLYGNEFELPAWPTDPCTVQLDVSAGISEDKARQSRIFQLTLGFATPKFHNAFVDHFIETWFGERIYWESYEDSTRLLHLLVEHMETNNNVCIFCAREGKSDSIVTNTEEHVRTHLLIAGGETSEVSTPAC